jgi:hypothetical protein
MGGVKPGCRLRGVGLALGLALSSLAPLRAPRADEAVVLRALDGKGRPFDLAELRGRVVALTFASRPTRDQAARVNEQLGAHSDAAALAVVSIVDLSTVPGFARGYAHRRIAEADRQGRVRHLVDDNGRLRERFEVHPERRVDILVIDRDGTLRGRYVGDTGLEAALQLIDELLCSPTARGPSCRYRGGPERAVTTRLRPCRLAW